VRRRSARRPAAGRARLRGLDERRALRAEQRSSSSTGTPSRRAASDRDVRHPGVPRAREFFRVFPDEGGRLALTSVDEDAAGSRLGKITNKSVVPGGDAQLTLHDGTNVLVDADTEYRPTKDSIVVDNESKDVVAHFEYEEGALVTAVAGQHAGGIGEVADIDITPGSGSNNVFVGDGRRTATRRSRRVPRRHRRELHRRRRRRTRKRMMTNERARPTRCASREPSKVVVHMGVGQGGEPLADAEEIIEEITDQQSVRTTSKRTIAEFGIRQGDPIGVKVCLREDARVSSRHRVGTGHIVQEPVRRYGEPEFRGREHTDFPRARNTTRTSASTAWTSTTTVRPGYRVAKRDKATRLDPVQTPTDPEDATAFLETNFDVEVTE